MQQLINDYGGLETGSPLPRRARGTIDQASNNTTVGSPRDVCGRYAKIFIIAWLVV